MANPLIDDYRRMQRIPVDAPPMIAQPMASGPIVLPSSASPVVRQQDPAIQATQTRLIGDQGEYQRKLDTGSGISQIQSKPLRIAARIGDIAERILLPGAERITPGTEGNHERMLLQDQQRVGQDIGNQGGQARTQQEQALTDYTLQRPEIEQHKIDQKQTAIRDRIAQAAASRGQLVTWDEEGTPSFQDDHESQAFKDHQALSAMHQATADKSQIMADIQKNHYIPGTPEWAEQQKKLAQVDQKLQVAFGSLGLRAKGLQLRQNDQNANFYGVGPDNQPLPNAPQFQDDDGNVTVGGLKGAKTAVTQQAAVGTFKDLGGSIARTRSLVGELHKSGGSLSDPRVVEALSDAGDHQGVISTVLRSKLSKAGMSEAQVNAVAAVASLREQLGTLRAASKGTGSEGQTQRMLTAAPTGGDTPELADRKFAELQATYERLAPSISSIGGGMSLNGKGGRHGGSPTTYKQTATGQGGHKIGSNDNGNTWFDVQTGKAVQ